MKTLMLIAAGVMTVLGTAGCTDYGYYRFADHDRYAGDYDVYYDDYYGPVREGYWGDDGLFYYRDNTRRWQRDDARHFRRDAYNGYHNYRVYRGER